MSFFLFLLAICSGLSIMAVWLDHLLTSDISHSSTEEDNDNGF